MFVVGYRIAEFGLLSESLVDYRAEERDVVFLYVIDVRFVGYPQLQRGAVEVDRHDGLEPLDELLLGGLLPDTGQAVLPHIAVCRIVEHEKRITKGANVYTILITNSDGIDDEARIYADDIYYVNRKEYVDWAVKALRLEENTRSFSKHKTLKGTRIKPK